MSARLLWIGFAPLHAANVDWRVRPWRDWSTRDGRWAKPQRSELTAVCARGRRKRCIWNCATTSTHFSSIWCVLSHPLVGGPRAPPEKSAMNNQLPDALISSAANLWCPSSRSAWRQAASGAEPTSRPAPAISLSAGRKNGVVIQNEEQTRFSSRDH